MKETWLYTALCAIGICLLPYPYVWGLWPFITLFLWKRQGFYCLLSFALLFVIMYRCQPITIQTLDQQERLRIGEIHTSYVIAHHEKGKILLYQAEDYDLDDIIDADIDCEALNSNKNFGLFQFSAYMKKRGITQSCQLNKGSLIRKGNTLKARIWQKVNRYNETDRQWLKQTVYHIQDQDTEPLEMIGSTGIHLSLLLHMLTKIGSLWISKRKAQSIGICMIVMIAHITAWKDSLVRMFCFRLIAFLLPHENHKDLLGISVLLLLMLRPYIVNELVFVLPFLFRFSALFQQQSYPRLCYTFAVLIPLQFYYFHEVDLIQLLLFGIIRIFYMINYACAFIALWLPISFFSLIGIAVLDMIRCLEAVHLSFYYQASLLFVIVWFCFLLKLLHTYSTKSLSVLILLCLYSQTASYFRPYAQVLMIDVGQGDCTLISLPFHQGNILIDVAGSETKNIPKDIIVPALHAQGITDIDAVIITHDDLDHSGGLAQLQELMEVKKVITKKQEQFTMGKFHFQFLLADHEFTDKNENSIITYCELFQLRFLFMGDAGKQAERMLLQRYPKLTADVLKVGHHGSKSASSPPFLHSLHPLIGLISCGAHNFYGHPHQEVLDALNHAQVKTLDTPTYGAISIKITNIFQIYQTATHDFGIIISDD